jgi:tRNA threonylcarbamoyladenosine biosynthesis protein TsaB
MGVASRRDVGRVSMKVLLLHTCGAEGSAALADSLREEPVVAMATMPGRTASERLVAVIRELVEEAGWRLAELGAVVVVSGPGSFTGVRVGLSAAKGLSDALGTPVVAVSRLALLAGAARPVEGEVCAVLDAGRGEYYCGQYRRNGEGAGECVAETLVGFEDALALARRAGAGAVIACEAKVAEAFAAVSPRVMLDLVGEPTAADALPIAWERIEQELFDDPVTLDANYLRRTDAEIFAKKAGNRE